MNATLAALHDVDVAARRARRFRQAGQLFRAPVRPLDRASTAPRRPATVADMDRLIAWLDEHMPADDGHGFAGAWRLPAGQHDLRQGRAERDRRARLGTVDARPSLRRSRLPVHAVAAAACLRLSAASAASTARRSACRRRATMSSAIASGAASPASATGPSTSPSRFSGFAAICQGVYKRALDGNASNPEKAQAYGDAVTLLAGLAVELIEGKAETWSALRGADGAGDRRDGRLRPARCASGWPTTARAWCCPTSMPARLEHSRRRCRPRPWCSPATSPRKRCRRIWSRSPSQRFGRPRHRHQQCRHRAELRQAAAGAVGRGAPHHRHRPDGRLLCHEAPAAADGAAVPADRQGRRHRQHRLGRRAGRRAAPVGLCGGQARRRRADALGGGRICDQGHPRQRGLPGLRAHRHGRRFREDDRQAARPTPSPN